MSITRDLSLLKRGLGTEIKLALAGETRQSVVLLLREDCLPMAQITDENGRVANKILSLVDLLSILDNSATISQLEQAETRTVDLPPLPPNTLLTTVQETPEGRSLVLTGYVEPDDYVFVLRENGSTRTFDLSLPHVVYRAVYDERRGALSNLSLTLAEPGPWPGEGGAEGRTSSKTTPAPVPETHTLRYPFSNVYHSASGASEGVCWHGLRDLAMEPRDIPEQAVKRFIRTENNADLYGRGLSHNAPCDDYAQFLQTIENEGGIHEDYLIPTRNTIEGLHYRKAPKTSDHGRQQ